MRQQDLDWIIQNLHLSPDQADRLKKEMSSAKLKVSIQAYLTPDPGFLRGATPPQGDMPPLLSAVLADLTPEMRAKLTGIEPQVLSWLEANPGNRTLFARDPLKGLRKAVPDLDEDTHSALARLRQKHSQPPPDLDIEIKDVSVDTKGTKPGR